jgi:hypothetical protein
MTTHTDTPPATGRPPTARAAGPYLIRDHTVTGTAIQLANLVANHHNAGTLVAMTAPRPVGDRFQILIRVREPRPTIRVTSVGEHARTRIRLPRRGARIAVIATTITGTAAGLIAVAVYLLGQLIELITVHAALILGVLALAAILAAAAARRNSSGSRHCPGC